MRILVDEDLASRELMARLRKAGHHLETLEKGSTDAAVWDHAQAQELILLTRNAADFIELGSSTSAQHGLFIVYDEHAPGRNMTPAAIAAALAFVRETLGEQLKSKVLALNDWRR